jgi:aerobic carbon-monoxide dehydrogenase medium subunit
MIATSFDYESPRSLSEAFELLNTYPDAKLLAGGHSLLPAMKLRVAMPSMLIDLSRIAGLNQIRDTGERISVGALTTHATVAASLLLHEHCPLLPLAAAQIGDAQVRNRGTIGGSLAQAHPAADYPAAVLALDAEIVAQSRSGERIIPAREFFTGMLTTSLKANEVITEIRVPKTGTGGVAYLKHHHPASGYAVVGVAVRLKMSGNKVDDAAVAITGVSDAAYRAKGVEGALRGKGPDAFAEASKHAADGVDALGDTYASVEFRKHLASVMVRRALEQAKSA